MMKKKVCFALKLLIVCFFTIFVSVKADSGWDYDYDSSGSSWGSSSSWGSGSSWDYDSDGGSWHSSSSSHSSGYNSSSSSGHFFLYADSNIMIMLIIFIIAMIYVGTLLRNMERKSKSKVKNTMYADLTEEKIREVDPNLNLEEFKNDVFEIYNSIQVAWMNFDTETIRKNVTDEIYNMYKSQLEILKRKHQKNMMEEITLKDIKLIRLEKENDCITASVYLEVKCRDYVINEKTKAIVRGTKQPVIIEYVLTFIKSALPEKEMETCPNCGAPIEMNGSATCPYCDSTLVKTSKSYVMSKKTVINQRKG